MAESNRGCSQRFQRPPLYRPQRETAQRSGGRFLADGNATRTGDLHYRTDISAAPREGMSRSFRGSYSYNSERSFRPTSVTERPPSFMEHSQSSDGYNMYTRDFRPTFSSEYSQRLPSRTSAHQSFSPPQKNTLPYNTESCILSSQYDSPSLPPDHPPSNPYTLRPLSPPFNLLASTSSHSPVPARSPNRCSASLLHTASKNLPMLTRTVSPEQRFRSTLNQPRMSVPPPDGPTLLHSIPFGRPPMGLPPTDQPLLLPSTPFSSRPPVFHPTPPPDRPLMPHPQRPMSLHSSSASERRPMLLQSVPHEHSTPPDRFPVPLRPLASPNRPPTLLPPPDHLMTPLPLHRFERPPVSFACATVSAALQSQYTGLDPIQRFRKQTEERRSAQQWINDWVSKRPSISWKKNEIKLNNRQDPLLIPLVRSDIKSCFEYLSLLEKKRKVLQDECDLQMWKWEVSDVEVAMTTIKNLMSKLRNPDLCKRIKLKLLKIRKKKGQRMRRRERIRRETDERTEKLRRINAEIEEKRRREETAANLQVDEEIKATKVSQEKLKQRQEDVKRCLRTITALSKLREARLQKRKVELGVDSNPERDEAFQKGTDNLNELLQQQLKKYCEEEDVLTAKMKSDAEPKSRINMLVEGIKGYLFGEALSASHPLYSLYMEYTKADNNVDALVDIRSQWDAYVVTDDHPMGSRVPVDWVYPSVD